MLDEEKQSEPVGNDGFDAVLAAVDDIEIEPESPAEAAAPTAETPVEPPAEAPAPEGTASPDVAEAATDAPAQAADPAAEAVETTPEPEAPVEIEIGGQKYTVEGARYDKGRGDRVTMAKDVLENTLRTHVEQTVQRERTNFGRERAQLQGQLKQATESKTANEHTAEVILGELDKIAERALTDEAGAYDEFTKLVTGYADRKATAERDYWKAQATGQSQTLDQVEYQRQMSEYIPALQGHLRRFTEQAVESVADKLAGLSDAERKEFTEELYQDLLDEADVGRIFTHTGEKIPNTLLPKLDVNFQRIATVVERKLGRTRKTLDLVASRDAELKRLREQTAKVEGAAKINAAAEAKRRGTPAPPAVSGKPGDQGAVQTKKAQSWNDIEAEIDKM